MGGKTYVHHHMNGHLKLSLREWRDFVAARLRLVLLLLIMLLGYTPCYASDVAAIKDRNLRPFKEAVEGFEATTTADIHVYIIDMKRDPTGKKLTRTVKKKKVDMIYALGSKALKLAIDKLKEIPIVFSYVLKPEKIIGDTDDKRTIAGISMLIPPGEQLSAFKIIAPTLNRIGVVYDSTKSNELIKKARSSAQELGITLVEKTISNKEEAVSAVYDLKGQIDCVLMLPDTTFVTAKTMKHLLLFSFKNNIPIIGLSDKYVKQGALLALSFNNREVGKQAGEIASKIISGEDIPRNLYLDPRSLELSINKKTADKLGISIQESVLKTAHQVYE